MPNIVLFHRYPKDLLAPSGAWGPHHGPQPRRLLSRHFETTRHLLCKLDLETNWTGQHVSKRVKRMTKQQLFETSANRASQETTQIETLIGRLARTAELMDADINQEEKLASVSDPRDPAYPMIARSLKARRDNLTASISSLQALVNTGRNSTYSKQEEKASQSTAQIETLIRRLARTAEIMDADIKHEEKLAQVSDPRDPAYPMVAQSLKARRDNLRASIISLQSLLNAGGPQCPTARSVTAHD
jgi:hypothetical protein